MKILILHRGTSYSRDQIITEAKKRHHQIDLAAYADLEITYHNANDPQKNIVIKTADKVDLFRYDYIIPRGPLEFRHILQMIAAYCDLHKINILNKESLIKYPKYDKSIQYYLLGLKNLPLIPSYLDREGNSFREITKQYGLPFIYKYTKGFAGGQVYLIRQKSDFKEIPDYKKVLSERNFLIQRYWPGGCDYRVIIVGKKVLGGMKRTASNQNEYRNNYSLGGQVEGVVLNSTLKKLALQSCRATSCDYAGVDIIFWQNKPYILEVNRYCHFEGFDKANHTSVAAEIINYLEKKYDQKK